MRRVLTLLAAGAVGGLTFPAAAAPVSYKGRTIVMGDSAAASQCLELVKKGIDMADTLPPKLKSLGSAVKDLKCDPPRMGSNEVRDNVVGVYTMTSKTEAKGFIDFRRSPASLTAAQYTVALVVDGVYAGWHRDSVRAAKDPAQGDKARHLETILTKGNLSDVLNAECVILSTTRDTLQALDLDPRHASGVARTMRERNCR